MLGPFLEVSFLGDVPEFGWLGSPAKRLWVEISYIGSNPIISAKFKKCNKKFTFKNAKNLHMQIYRYIFSGSGKQIDYSDWDNFEKTVERVQFVYNLIGSFEVSQFDKNKKLIQKETIKK